ncbi:type II secretion system protein E [Solidesulfovibrio carbinoliphilus]|nr:type II secretion system protein E [Solidesulfovibrio carbinoliphilus]
MSQETDSMANDRVHEPERAMDGEEAIMAAMVAGLCGAPVATETALAGRLARLEEHFARLCTVVGRLEQELAGLRGHAAGHGR